MSVNYKSIEIKSFNVYSIFENNIVLKLNEL